MKKYIKVTLFVLGIILVLTVLTVFAASLISSGLEFIYGIGRTRYYYLK